MIATAPICHYLGRDIDHIQEVSQIDPFIMPAILG
jgi:hypothetical protein